MVYRNLFNQILIKVKITEFEYYESFGQIVLTAEMGDNYQGDIAIDNIVVQQDTCPGEAK